MNTFQAELLVEEANGAPLHQGAFDVPPLRHLLDASVEARNANNKLIRAMMDVASYLIVENQSLRLRVDALERGGRRNV